mmetsp:Transcript_7297/g.10689  ORF Transcript_7297/g.10689 Transcript_7297/m.10689 type:complete len:83 (+) Transcript_7297:72-320(+)
MKVLLVMLFVCFFLRLLLLLLHRVQVGAVNVPASATLVDRFACGTPHQQEANLLLHCQLTVLRPFEIGFALAKRSQLRDQRL